MWIKIKATDNKTHIINVNAIMQITYNDTTDLTIIEFTRAAFPAVYVNGNVMKEFQTAVKNDNKIISLGE